MIAGYLLFDDVLFKSLNFRLLFQSWNEIAEREEKKDDDDATKERLVALVREIVPSQMKHHAEAEACDLLMEVERLDLIHNYVDAQSYQVTS